MKFLSVLFFGFIFYGSVSSWADDFDDHWDAIKNERVLFKMANESFDEKSIRPGASKDLFVVSGQVSGRYKNDSDYGYVVEVRLNNDKKKRFYFGVEAVENPLNYLFFRGWLPRVIKTVSKDRGIDPCYTHAPPYSLWYLQNQTVTLEKVDTAVCPGKEPFVTPEIKGDLERLNLVRDFILMLGAAEPLTPIDAHECSPKSSEAAK